MQSSAPLVTVFGGSGFVGRYIVRRMARQGWRVRVAVRRPNEALFLRPCGDVGQVEPVQANLRDEASTRAALRGADAAVIAVGELFPDARQSFAALQAEGPGRVARLAAEAGVARLVHLSAIGADALGSSTYARTKAEGEARVLAAMPGATILRPSVIFGPEDRFFNRFASMARFSPVLPVVGAATRFQPVWVEDVAAAAEVALIGEARGTFELGGPEIETFEALLRRMLKVIRRERLLLPVPFWLAHIKAANFAAAEAATFGLFRNRLLTRDQVRLLESDNVVAAGARTLADLGIRPTAMEAVLESYLYSYRPYGQYSEITESARRLRDG
jgi:NADH dehydrogenase